MTVSSPSSGRVMGGLSRAVIEVARLDDCDLTDVLAAHDLSLAELDRADSYVSVELHEQLWTEGARRTGRSDFGLHAARHFNPGLTGVVEYILRNCANVGEALTAWLRWATLVSDCISGAYERSGERVLLYWRLNRPASEGCRHWAEFAQGRTLHLIRQGMSMTSTAPEEVWFTHTAPADSSPHRRLFGAPVHFEKPEHALIWPSSWLDSPLKGVDPSVLVALEERAKVLRADVESSHDTTRRGMTMKCQQAIQTLLLGPGRDARLEKVAARLGLSPRSLQRKLRAEEQTFQAVLDRVRRTEAIKLNGSMTFSAMAARLGFNDDAALRKAQRRWATMASPAQTSEYDGQ